MGLLKCAGFASVFASSPDRAALGVGSSRNREFGLSRPSLPAVAWLGSPPSGALGAAIKRFAGLNLGWTSGAAVVCAWAASGVGVLTDLPPAHRRPKVIAVFQGAPPVRERLAWIRAGADEVMALDGLTEHLVRLLHPNGPPPPPEPEPAPAPPRAPTPAPARPVQPAPAAASLAAPLAFPKVWPGPIVPAERAEALLTPIITWLRTRNAVARRLGDHGLSLLIGLSHQRDQLKTSWSAPASSDPYGQRRGGAPALDWPVGVRSLERRGQGGEAGRLMGLARDGLTLQLDLPKAPRQRLVLDLNLGDAGYVQLLVECRWQRRVSARRWLVGALMLRARLC